MNKEEIDIEIIGSEDIPSGIKRAPCYATNDRVNPGAIDISLYLENTNSAS